MNVRDMNSKEGFVNRVLGKMLLLNLKLCLQPEDFVEMQLVKLWCIGAARFRFSIACLCSIFASCS